MTYITIRSAKIMHPHQWAGPLTFAAGNVFHTQLIEFIPMQSFYYYFYCSSNNDIMPLKLLFLVASGVGYTTEFLCGRHQFCWYDEYNFPLSVPGGSCRFACRCCLLSAALQSLLTRSGGGVIEGENVPISSYRLWNPSVWIAGKKRRKKKPSHCLQETPVEVYVTCCFHYCLQTSLHVGTFVQVYTSWSCTENSISQTLHGWVSRQKTPSGILYTPNRPQQCMVVQDRRIML